MTLIEHGTTYQNRSYEDMAASTDKKDVSYVKWIQTQENQNPFIADFVDYLHYYDLLHPKSEVLTFAGTRTVRRFAPDTEKGE